MPGMGDRVGNRSGEEFCLWALVVVWRGQALKKVVGQCDS